MEFEKDYFIIRDKDGKPYVFESDQADLSKLDRFMRKVIYTDQKAFVFKPKVGLARAGYVKASKLADGFFDLLTFKLLHRRDKVYAPLLDLYFQVLQCDVVAECAGSNPNAFTGNVANAVHFNDFVERLREVGKQIDIKQKVRDWESGSRNNLKRLKTFERAIFTNHARVMVIRMDGYYHAATPSRDEAHTFVDEHSRLIASDQLAYANGEALNEIRPAMGRIELEAVLADKDRLFANRRGKRELFDNLVGYVWRVEFTPQMGYHIHFAFFFIGLLKHEWLAQQIGHYWAEKITGGRGYFHNCNLDQSKYGENWALGLVDHWDMDKREKLMYALSYLAKEDQRVHVKPHRKCRLFGAVILNGREKKNKGGRPRKARVFS